MGTTKVGVYRRFHGPDKRDFNWEVRWFGVEGRRYSKAFKTNKNAQRFAEQKQQEVRQGNADSPPMVTLRYFSNEHLQVMRHVLRPTTLGLHRTAIAFLASELGWECVLSGIRQRDIERLLANRRKAISTASANRELRTLKSVFNHAIVRRYLHSGQNPCVGVPLPKVGDQKIPYVCPEQFKAILNIAPDALWRAMLVVFYTTALRLREGINLTWTEINLKERRVYVTRRKGSGFVQSWSPKDHECRMIPLSTQAAELLEAWQSIAPVGCPYVFMEQARWNYYSERVEKGQWTARADLVNNILRRFKTLCRRAKVGPFTVHDLRRSCITNWARQLPVHVVQQLAGHADIDTTRRYYLSVQPDDVARAQQVQDELLGKMSRKDLTNPQAPRSQQKRAFPGRQGNQPVSDHD